MRRAACLGAAFCLALVSLAGAAPRDDALRALDDRDDVDGRRVAVRTLQDTGTMADVPRRNSTKNVAGPRTYHRDERRAVPTTTAVATMIRPE